MKYFFEKKYTFFDILIFVFFTDFILTLIRKYA